MNQISSRIHVDPIIKDALKEDINNQDISTNAIYKTGKEASVELICKEDGILSGIDIFTRTFEILDNGIKFDIFFKDGQNIKSRDIIGKINGDVRTLLSGERVALNFLQRMSGIATYTYKMVSKLEGTSTKLVDTRKTTPNLRILEKYAVRTGGGHNHRYNLSDAVMLKDNHILAAGGITEAINMAREYTSFVHKIEVEVETLDQVIEAVKADADIIMLDNMTPEKMKEAIDYIDGRAITEASGNITLDNIHSVAKLGVDIISSGALTHSAPVLDLSMKNLNVI